MPLIVRTLTAAIAIATLAAPTALARPADIPPPVAQAAAKAYNQPDPRSPDTAIRHQGPWSSLPGENTTSTRPKPLPGPPTWPVNAQPLTPAPAAKATDGGNGVDWATIGLGVAGSLLALGGLAALTRRTQRVRATT